MMSDQKTQKKGSKVPLQFIIGLALALGAGVSMYFFTAPLLARLAVGGLGIVLIATSKYRLL